MRKTSFLFPFLFLFAATTAMAEGFYGGAGIALTQIEDEYQGISFEDDQLGWRILAGYDFSDNFAVEGSYINSGTAMDDVLGENMEVELSAFTLALVGLLPVSESAQLFARVGFYTGEQEVTFLDMTVDDDEDGAIVGAGIRYKSSDGFAIRGEFEWYDTPENTRVWSVGVGVQYYFGK